MRSVLASFVVAFVMVACGRTSGPTGAEPLPVQSGGTCAPAGAVEPAIDGCNTCTCQDGAWACTEETCEAPPAECAEGKTKSVSCNACTCVSGMWSCTENDCPPDACVSGSSKVEGGSHCVCVDSLWACTTTIFPLICIDGETKVASDGCNTCTCQNQSWACTSSACSAPCGGNGGEGGSTACP